MDILYAVNFKKDLWKILLNSLVKIPQPFVFSKVNSGEYLLLDIHTNFKEKSDAINSLSIPKEFK